MTLKNLLSTLPLNSLALSFPQKRESGAWTGLTSARRRRILKAGLIALSTFITGIGLAPGSANATLLGVTPYLPTIDFSGSGNISYQANTGFVTISAEPSSLFSIDPLIYGNINAVSPTENRSLIIQFQVDNTGMLVPNNSPADLILIGSLDTDFDNTPDYSGTLLTAKVTNFGYLNGANNGDDTFDFTLGSVGGELAFLYPEQNLASLVISEASGQYPTPFNGNFASDWQGQAKGIIGLVIDIPTNAVPLPAALWLWVGALATIAPNIRRKINA